MHALKGWFGAQFPKDRQADWLAQNKKEHELGDTRTHAPANRVRKKLSAASRSEGKTIASIAAAGRAEMTCSYHPAFPSNILAEQHPILNGMKCFRGN